MGRSTSPRRTARCTPSAAEVHSWPGSGRPARRCSAPAERSAGKQRERLLKAAALLVDGEIDREGYELLRDEARAEMENIQQELARLRMQAPRTGPPDLDTVLQDAGGWQTAIRSSDVGEQRAVLGEVLDCVKPVRVAHNVYEAGIEWSPTGEALRGILEALDASTAA